MGITVYIAVFTYEFTDSHVGYTCKSGQSDIKSDFM